MRMVSRFVNEAALCLQDGIIAEATVGGARPPPWMDK